VNGILRHRRRRRRSGWCDDLRLRDLDRLLAVDRDEISRSCAIGLGAGRRLVNDLNTTVAIGDKCTLVVDFRPYLGIAETVLEPHARVISLGVRPRTLIRRFDMVSVHTRRWLVAVTAFGAVSLGTAACKKDSDKAATADKTTDNKGGDTKAGASTGAITGVVGDDLSLLPVDSEAVLGINFSQVQQSALWKQFVAPKLAASDLSGNPEVQDAVADSIPLETLKSVAVRPQGARRVTRRPARSSFTASTGRSDVVLRQGRRQRHREGRQQGHDRRRRRHDHRQSGKQFGFTFVNDTTALAVIGPEAASEGRHQEGRRRRWRAQELARIRRDVPEDLDRRLAVDGDERQLADVQQGRGDGH